jgi:hypothetical protein
MGRALNNAATGNGKHLPDLLGGESMLGLYGFMEVGRKCALWEVFVAIDNPNITVKGSVTFTDMGQVAFVKC